ncbi:hypothetical protein OIV83_003137 [Microbotryomycetes sp. JL201]|nr:hypothetical protein OIV83_003137 [Microbotryomycetes sp. JL201]
MQDSADDSARAASSSSANAAPSGRPFRGFSPPRWIVSLSDAELRSQSSTPGRSAMSDAAQQHRTGQSSHSGPNRRTKLCYDGFDDDIPSYGPTLRRRGNVNFVKAQGLEASEMARRPEISGGQNRGSSVKGLYESIVGIQVPNPPPAATQQHTIHTERKRTPHVVEVDVDLTGDDDDDGNDEDILIIDSRTGERTPYVESKPRRYIVPPPAPSSVFNANRPVLDPAPSRAIHEMLPVNLEPLQLPPNYHLRSSNVGWQMLSRQGWNEGNALGPAVVEQDVDGSESKRLKVPLRPLEKHDRRGLGLEVKSEPRKTRAEIEAERKRLALLERDKRGRRARGMERQKKKEAQDHRAMLAYMNRD